MDWSKVLSHCDQRIISLELNINKCHAADEILKVKYVLQVKFFKILINLVKTQKLVYETWIRHDSEPKVRPLFKVLLEKYNELVCETYELSREMVETGTKKESDHIEYCSSSLKQQQLIKTLCDTFKS